MCTIRYTLLRIILKPALKILYMWAQLGRAYLDKWK